MLDLGVKVGLGDNLLQMGSDTLLGLVGFGGLGDRMLVTLLKLLSISFNVIFSSSISDPSI
jgi:hypothetical protein